MTAGNAELVRHLYDRVVARDPSTLDLVADDFELDDPDLPGGGEFRGREGLAEYLRLWLDAWEEYRLEIEELREVDDRVVALLRHMGRGKGSGVASELRDAHVWTIEDGVPVRCRTYLDRGAALRDAGLPSGGRGRL
jgi:ketosteroid isomerase-like protein